MRKTLLAAMLATCIPAHASAESGATPQTKRSIVTNATRELGRNLVANHATLDDARVVALRPITSCTATIVTTKGSVAVSWKALGNLAPRLIGGFVLYRIPAGVRTHLLSVREGRVAEGIGAGLSVLDEECGGA